jgi:hypothetical protein
MVWQETDAINSQPVYNHNLAKNGYHVEETEMQ